MSSLLLWLGLFLFLRHLPCADAAFAAGFNALTAVWDFLVCSGKSVSRRRAAHSSGYCAMVVVMVKDHRGGILIMSKLRQCMRIPISRQSNISGAVCTAKAAATTAAAQSVSIDQWGDDSQTLQLQASGYLVRPCQDCIVGQPSIQWMQQTTNGTQGRT